MAVGMVGCASLKDGNESIIHVQAAQDPAKAIRLTLVGVKAMQSGDIDRAAEKFVAAVEADEMYGPAHNNLGLLHYEQGNLYQAVLAFEQAMELMPQDPIVYYNLGLTLESSGKVHEAMDLYWQAVEMDPVNPHFLGNLVRLKVRLGEEGPELITQLQDLILIETRPDWRHWADRQLALVSNDSLDRGPETPEFNTRGERGQSDEGESADNIIDLTPTTGAPGKGAGSGPRQPEDALFSEPKIVPSPEFNAPRVNSRPLRVHDEGSLETLPPAIDVVPAQDSSPDYFR